MREAYGGTWITGLVISFMLIFVSFLALALNYTKAFQMKNELLTILEKYEGATTGDNGSISIINNYLKNKGYSTMGYCEDGSYGVSNLNSSAISDVNESAEYYYCITKVSSPTANNASNVYYKVNTYFYFNLPIIGDIFKFDISGSTNNIARTQDDLDSVSDKGGKL